MAKAEISFQMGLDYAGFMRGIKAAENATKATADAMKSVMLKTAGVLAVAFGVKKFADMTLGVFEAGKAIDSLSRETGFAAETLTLMQHALDRSGASMADTAGILTTMREGIRNLRLGSTDAVLAFTRLGLTFGELQAMSPEKQFSVIAERINQIEDPVKRAATATQLLGAAGAKAAANFNAGDIERASKLFGKSSEEMAKNSAALARAHDAFQRMQQGAKAVFEVIYAKLAPAFEAAGKALEEVLPMLEEYGAIFAEYAQKAVTVLLNAFASGQIGELLWLALKYGFMKGVDFFARSMNASMSALTEIIRQAFSVMSTGDFWFAFSDAAIGAFEIIANSAGKLFLKMFEAPLKFLQDGITFVMERMMATINPLMKARSFADIQKQDKLSFGGMMDSDFDKNIEGGMAKVERAGKSFQSALEKGGASFDRVLEEFMKGMDGAGIFGSAPDEAMAKLKGLVSDLMKGTIIPISKAPAKPGEGPVKRDAPFVYTAFDALRRVGGGMAGGVRGVAERQLDKLTEISNTLKQMGKKNWTGATMTGQPVSALS